jgi:hypothetical protein
MRGKMAIGKRSTTTKSNKPRIPPPQDAPPTAPPRPIIATPLTATNQLAFLATRLREIASDLEAASKASQSPKRLAAAAKTLIDVQQQLDGLRKAAKKRKRRKSLSNAAVSARIKALAEGNLDRGTKARGRRLIVDE